MIESIREWRQTAERGYKWLLSRTSEGSFHDSQKWDINWLAKLPWTFAANGNRPLARRILTTVRDYLRDGTIHTPHSVAWTNAVSYALGWLVSGARVCDDFISARLLYSELQRYVCPVTGGLAGTIVGIGDQTTYFDVGIQGALLHAALAVGDLETARRNAHLLRMWFDDQPERLDRLYSRYHPGSGFIRDVPAGEEIALLFSLTEQRQPWANLGFVLQGLSRLSAATGEGHYRELAEEILDLILSKSRDDLLGHSQNHKVGHACLLLYEQTDNDDYLHLTMAIADKVASNILPDGRAWADVTSDTIENQGEYFTVRTTCDSVLWLISICDGLDGLRPIV